MAKKRKQPVGGKKPVASFRGSLKGPLKFEILVLDKYFEFGALDKDIKRERVSFEGPADDEGWMDLFFSADGPTGDPFPIGKIRFQLNQEALDGHFENLSTITLEQEK